jgi:hypothetical protein
VVVRYLQGIQHRPELGFAVSLGWVSHSLVDYVILKCLHKAGYNVQLAVIEAGMLYLLKRSSSSIDLLISYSVC